MSNEFHVSDRELLMAVDGELPAREAERVASHLAACWACRARKQEIESSIGEFIRFRDSSDGRIPPSDGPRALLRAHLRRMTEAERTSEPLWLQWIARRSKWAALAAGLLLAASSALILPTLSHRYSRQLSAVTVPDPSLTPGATVLVGEREVCMQASIKNKTVPVALQRKVFAEYGLGPAEPGAYEVDYLITPALGGADDIRNLWPESNRATAWNAQVKDALEDHLRDLVCEGQLDLATAQHELAGNWIEAYKKYFHTERPLAGSR